MDNKVLVADQEVWLRAWCAVASCFNSDKAGAKSWADRCLKDFRETFPPVSGEKP